MRPVSISSNFLYLFVACLCSEKGELRDGDSLPQESTGVCECKRCEVEQRLEVLIGRMSHHLHPSVSTDISAPCPDKPRLSDSGLETESQQHMVTSYYIIFYIIYKCNSSRASSSSCFYLITALWQTALTSRT